jgi:hypothetical protein
MAQKAESKKETEKAAESARATQSIRWDDSKMTSNYANVCNVSSTREEMTLLFGTNQSWYAGQELTVQLTNRIIMNPIAAKRLLVLLGNIVHEYESRFGTLPIEIVSPPAGEQQS